MYLEILPRSHRLPAFHYTTPKLRLEAQDLSPTLLDSHSFHLICSATRCCSQIQSILSLRSALHSPSGRNPIFIWEPVPDLCIPSELEDCKTACKMVDVISPNDSELLFFFGEEGSEGEERWRAVEKCAEELLRSGIGKDERGSIVVRAGKEGCYLAILTPESDIRGRWLPAYHEDASNVIDPTGGGNGFLGGLAVGLLRSEEDGGMEKLIDAVKYGCVAASFCIEQVGVPQIEKSRREGERWNGSDVWQRLEEFRLRFK